jgi:hypothetical protein
VVCAIVVDLDGQLGIVTAVAPVECWLQIRSLDSIDVSGVGYLQDRPIDHRSKGLKSKPVAPSGVEPKSLALFQNVLVECLALQWHFSVHHLPVQKCVFLRLPRLDNKVTSLLSQLIALDRCAEGLLFACSGTGADCREETIAVANNGSELRTT